MTDTSTPPAISGCNDMPTSATSPRSYFLHGAYALLWIAVTGASSLYVQQRDGAGWPVAIWAVQIPDIIFSRRWLERRKLLGKRASSLPSLIAISIFLLLFLPQLSKP